MEPSIYKNLKKANKTQENRTNHVRAELSYVGSIWKKTEKAKGITFFHIPDSQLEYPKQKVALVLIHYEIHAILLFLLIEDP